MLKELNKLVERAKRQKATWERWYRKMPHNRVCRPRIRNERGWTIGYGPPVPVPEPALSPIFCSKVELPSGRLTATLADPGVERCYRQARYPKARREEVETLPLAESTIRDLYNQHCGR